MATQITVSTPKDVAVIVNFAGLIAPCRQSQSCPTDRKVRKFFGSSIVATKEADVAAPIPGIDINTRITLPCRCDELTIELRSLRR